MPKVFLGTSDRLEDERDNKQIIEHNTEFALSVTIVAYMKLCDMMSDVLVLCPKFSRNTTS